MAEPDADFVEEFFSNPAISYTTQPDLKLLFDTLANTDKRFTIFVGAGISLDGGLPLWPKLVDNIVEQISDEKWRREARLDENDLIRKAEYVVRLARESTASPPRVVVLNALYRKSSGNLEDNRNPEPGRLADAIARLCISLGDRADIVTTNFDVLLESALQKYTGIEQTPVPFRKGIDDKEWAGGKGVLHLHGILIPNEDPLGNVILTENDFLQHGPQIKSFMLDRIKKTNMLFVGVSMTDPNLVAPLWEFANPEAEANEARDRENGRASLPSHCFMLSVAAPNPKSSANAATANEAAQRALESRTFAIKRTSYLRRLLGVKTIFFKSYGEQIQAIYEASLALRDYETYKSGDAATSTRYGFRLMRALNESYKNIGCADDEEMPVGDHADTLSDRLHNYLTDPNSLIYQIIDQARSRTQGAALSYQFAGYQSQFDAERFGLFLWLLLRTRGRADSYELRLVGSSVYRHREGWSLDRAADISPTSRFPAGRAAFRGQAVIDDFPVNATKQLWGSAWAVPFSFYLGTSESENGTVDPRDSIEVGVISLQSTHFWSDDDAAWSSSRPRSILSTIKEQQANRFIDALAGAAREIVTTPASSPT